MLGLFYICIMKKFSVVLLSLLISMPISSFAKREKLSRRDKEQIRQLKQLSLNAQTLAMYQNNIKNLKRLNERYQKSQIVGLELIIADASDIRVESRYGHAMLRFVDTSRSSNNDITLGFVADLENSSTNYVKGIIGSYPVFPILRTLGDFVEQYIKGEERALKRYIIPISSSDLNSMISQLNAINAEIVTNNFASLKRQAMTLKQEVLKKLSSKKYEGYEIEPIVIDDYVLGYTLENKTTEKSDVFALELNPTKSEVLGGYTFLKNNCAGALVNFLRSTSFGFLGKVKIRGRIPVKLDRFFASYGMINYGEFLIPNTKKLKDKLVKITGVRLNDLYDFDTWKNIKINKFMNEFTTPELMMILDLNIFGINHEQKQVIIKYLAGQSNKPNYDELYQIQEQPVYLYQSCSSLDCFEKQYEFVSSKKDHSEILSYLKLKKNLKRSPKFYKQMRQFYIDRIGGFNE